MTLEYIIAGGQLKIDKKVFAKELLLPGSPLTKLIKIEEKAGSKQPMITKEEDIVIINYNDASDIFLDESFDSLFRSLKSRYKAKIKGSIVIRITALTTYHVVLNLNSEDETIKYDH